MNKQPHNGNGRRRNPPTPQDEQQGQVDFMLSKPMPHHVQSEGVILGSILLDNALIPQVAALLEPGDFYVRAHFHIFHAMLTLDAQGQPIDPITLGRQLERDETLSQVGGIAFISELTYGLPHFTNVGHYCKIVRDLSVERQLIKVSNATASLGLDAELTTEEKLEQAEALLLALVDSYNRVESGHAREGFVSLREDRRDIEQMLENYLHHRTDSIPTGIKELDALLDDGGLQRQGLYYVGASPKTGKTSLALGIAEHVAGFLGLGVGIVSEEMRRLALIKRLLSTSAGVEHWMMRPGMYEKTYREVMAHLDRFTEMPIYITDSAFTVPQIRRHCRRLVYGPAQARLIIVDYLQLVSLTGVTDYKQRAAEVGALSREMKRMAQELNVPVIAMSQLNRDSVREARRPEMFDLRESGQLEADAEAILFLWNPNYKPGQPYQDNPDGTRDITLIIGAQRNGPANEDIEMKFLKRYMQFKSREAYRQLTASPGGPLLERQTEAAPVITGHMDADLFS